jgi:putative endonuclease
MSDRGYFVYILASHSRVLYIGATNDLARRLAQHRAGLGAAFPRKYRCVRLVYFEMGRSRREVLERERVLKGWLRAKKIALIESTNPAWHDLSVDWHPGGGG